MRRADFDKYRDSIYANNIVHLNDTKGKDYSGDGDAFANFKRNAERLQLTTNQVWAVYFFKHIDAIASFIATGEVKSEPIQGRIDDAITYLFLLRGMLHEELTVIDEYEANQEQPVDVHSSTPVKGEVEYIPSRESFILRGRHGSSEVTLERLDIARKEARETITIHTPMVPVGSYTAHENGCDCPPNNDSHSASCQYRIDWEAYRESC